jgi:hypothetical protein
MLHIPNVRACEVVFLNPILLRCSKKAGPSGKCFTDSGKYE